MGMGRSTIFDIYKKNMRNFAGFLAFLFLANLGFMGFGGERVSALYVPTLSVSAWRSEEKVKGSDVLKTENKTTETSVWFQIQTNNRTGYTASFSTETDNTALVNSNSSTNVKIPSINTDTTLANLPVNTWGYKLATSTNYSSLPGVSSPATIFQSTDSSYSGYKGIYIGMKLGDNLEGGSYENKLVFSVVTNPYEKKALMAKGGDIQSYLRNFNDNGAKTRRFKRSMSLPTNLENVKNIEDNNSDYEIKLWHDVAAETAYYYSEAEKIFLNENCNAMFADDIYGQYGLKNLEEIELSGFDTGKVKNMGLMFSNLKNLKQLDLSSFNTNNVTNMWGMFWGDEKIENLDLSNFDTSKVTSMNQMFSEMKNLKNLNISSFDTRNVVNMGKMFSNVNQITTLDLSNFNTENVTDMSGIFYCMSNLDNINISSFNTKNVEYMDSMFYAVSKLKNLNLSHFDTSKVKKMNSMFYGMSELVNLDVSSFNTKNVDDMGFMFQQVKKLPSLNLSSFDTSNVKNMGSMFYLMESLTDLNISNFRTPNVTNMFKMFCYTALSSIDVSKFDTSKVTYMSYMFNNMKNLTTLDLSNFDTREVTAMFAMFYNTPNLTSLDISNFNTEKVTTMSYIFGIDGTLVGVDKLEKIYVNNDFNTSNITDSDRMFDFRKKLRGGNGSFLANPSTADLSWLRVDRPEVQGYFTRKP